ncbi:hypothetical protein CRG98_010147 [Punica granatum]|uniref:DDE Tnp4 domain-containing protein n=1 Tax=Punica granatum TaxID=22663 RepID=A0A2I0KLT7_PUNGR|nr:hypothetical protein CRG98_010147 [Punica granatum]
MNTELEEQFPGVILGAMKLSQKALRLKIQYKHFIELIQHIGVGWDATTNTVPYGFHPPTPKSFDTYERIEEEFLAPQTSYGKEPINLKEGSDESDISVREFSIRPCSCKSVLTYSRLVSTEKKKEFTPPESKRSKSVSSPEKPTKNNIDEAMVVLNDMKPTISLNEYLTCNGRLADETTRWLFMCYHDNARNSRNGIIVEEMVGMFLLQDCIGAIDGTHVAARVLKEKRVAYRNRNNEITQNVLAGCSHQMIFTYVMTGWEGSADDSRILSDAARLELFPAPRDEQYYIVERNFPIFPVIWLHTKGNGITEVALMTTIFK